MSTESEWATDSDMEDVDGAGGAKDMKALLKETFIDGYNGDQ